MKIGVLIFVVCFISVPAYAEEIEQQKYAEDYAFVTCLARVFEVHLGDKNKVVIGLDEEAWSFVEKGDSSSDTYNRIYNSTALEAKKIPLNSVYRACKGWLIELKIRKLLPSSR